MTDRRRQQLVILNQGLYSLRHLVVLILDISNVGKSTRLYPAIEIPGTKLSSGVF